VPLCLPADARHAEPAASSNGLLRSAGGDPQPTLESDSMIVPCSRMCATGRWASVMPARLAETLGLTATIRAIPDRRAGSGAYHRPWWYRWREPMTPLNAAALVAEARRPRGGRLDDGPATVIMTPQSASHDRVIRIDRRGQVWT